MILLNPNKLLSNCGKLLAVTEFLQTNTRTIVNTCSTPTCFSHRQEKQIQDSLRERWKKQFDRSNTLTRGAARPDYRCTTRRSAGRLAALTVGRRRAGYRKPH